MDLVAHRGGPGGIVTPGDVGPAFDGGHNADGSRQGRKREERNQGQKDKRNP
jgi:hypothetical protein